MSQPAARGFGTSSAATGAYSDTQRTLASPSPRRSQRRGTQFTCFTGTNVQILTRLRRQRRRLHNCERRQLAPRVPRARGRVGSGPPYIIQYIYISNIYLYLHILVMRLRAGGLRSSCVLLIYVDIDICYIYTIYIY